MTAAESGDRRGRFKQNMRRPTLYTRFSMLDVLMRVVTFTTSPLSFFLYSTTVFTPLESGPVTEPTGISRSSSSSSVSAHLIFDAMLGNACYVVWPSADSTSCARLKGLIAASVCCNNHLATAATVAAACSNRKQAAI